MEREQNCLDNIISDLTDRDYIVKQISMSLKAEVVTEVISDTAPWFNPDTMRLVATYNGDTYAVVINDFMMKDGRADTDKAIEEIASLIERTQKKF